jgi:glucosamine-6-phosphate deaminase
VEIIIQPNPEEASVIAARHVARVVREKPNAVLGLATGQTPLAMYRELVRMHQQLGLDFSQVTTFNLDEYVGLPPEHPASYHAFMWEHFFGRVNVRPERVHIPDGLAPHVPAFCRSYEESIRIAGGIDLQVLGIGRDGHIGFNEPSSSLASRTRIKTLTAETRRDNAAAFGSPEKVPVHVITMGVGTIMDAREVLMLAFGPTKADAVAGAVEGPITAMNPASILQMHPTARCVMDEAAATKLKRTEYYRWVYDRKPDWQKL